MMNPSKASKLLSDYARNNYNAYKTLIQNGYSEKTADKVSKDVLQRASRVVKTQLHLDKELDTKETAQTALDILGVSREEVVKQLKMIAFNEKDFTNALKVLAILSKDIGINLTEPDQNKAPQVNLTIEKVETKGPHDINTA
jgi:Holliday junction resolvasome RuvABC DNA-binding subunit